MLLVQLAKSHLKPVFNTILVWPSLSEPHSYVESGVVAHMQRITVKNGIATHYCSLGMVVHVQTNTDDKLTDTSIQVHHNAKIFDFIY